MAKKLTQNNNGHWSSAPKITISAIASWDEYEMAWIPKTYEELSTNLKKFVDLAKEGHETVTISAGHARRPETLSLKRYKGLPRPKKHGNRELAKFFGKGGVPTMSQVQRAIAGTDHINEAIRVLYWYTAGQLRRLIRKYNGVLDDDKFGVPEFLKLVIRPVLKKPKDTSYDDIANYLIQKDRSGATRDWTKVEGLQRELLEALADTQRAIQKRKDAAREARSKKAHS